MTRSIKVFNYFHSLDCFVMTREYLSIAERLGFDGWEAGAWIGRLCALDNDFGEHVFDNHSERDALARKARERGYDPEDKAKGHHAP